MMCLVDCGVHEVGVEGLDAELQEIVNDVDDPKPDIKVRKFNSYIFLHKNSVTIEHIEWRPLFPPARLDADDVTWKYGQAMLSNEAIQNMRNRRKWRGCLIVDVKMATGRFRDGVVVLGGAASLAGQTRDVCLRQVFLHSPAGNTNVKWSDCSFVDHIAPAHDREVLTESLTTAINFAMEPTGSDLWAVLGDFNLDKKEAADNFDNVGDVDDDADDDDYAHFRQQCRAARCRCGNVMIW